MNDEPGSVRGDRQVAGKTPQDKAEGATHSRAAHPATSQPVLKPPSWLQIGLVTAGFLAGVYAAAFPDLLGCTGLHYAALSGLAAPIILPLVAFDPYEFQCSFLAFTTVFAPALIWLVPLLSSIMPIRPITLNWGLYAFYVIVVTPVAAGAWLLLEFYYGGRYPILDFLVVLFAVFWFGASVRRISSHKRPGQDLPSTWRFLWAPGLGLVLALLLWSSTPMRLNFWLHRFAFDKLVTEVRDHHREAIGSERIGHHFSPPRWVGIIRVHSVAMMLDGKRGAIETHGRAGFYWGELQTSPDGARKLDNWGILPLGLGVRGSPPRFRGCPVNSVARVSLGGDWHAYAIFSD